MAAFVAIYMSKISLSQCWVPKEGKRNVMHRACSRVGEGMFPLLYTSDSAIATSPLIKSLKMSDNSCYRRQYTVSCAKGLIQTGTLYPCGFLSLM